MLRPIRPGTSLAVLTLAIVLAACDENASTAPAPLTSADGDASSTVYGNEAARALLATLPLPQANPIVQARVFAYFSIAWHNAIVAAERRR